MLPARPFKPEPAVLAVICSWEAAALITGRLPTITTIVMRLHRLARVVLVAAATAWLVGHFELRVRR